MSTLAHIVALLGCPVPATTSADITGIASLSEATPTEISYVASDAFVHELAQTRAAAIIAQKRVKLPATWTRPALIVDDADVAVAKVLALFAPPIPRPPAGVDRMARVDASATLGEGVAIGPFAFVGARARLGARSVIHPGVYVGQDVSLGDDCELFPNVTIRERVTLGHRVVIHSNSAIGADGFGYRWDGQRHVKVPQIGQVIIEDDVEIGACSCVDRAKFSATRIGRGTKIDNLVQIGHNVQTGPHCIITGYVGLAGSVKLGAGVVLGGRASVRDHVSIGDGAMIAGLSGVADDVPAGQIYSGTPAIPHRQNLREQKALRRLPDLQVQIRALQDEIESLKKKSP
ncbi:MAG TPA: UDP-3-O-(3-hydroxymyristoyl)glucosamine N-acyltransferase [Tepidisphaeraceae bacterium]|jgi:UDP-3-O-[3-hydroxymyristoyl] glucosamine N-acyltransferase|nr:UDP-3-O-(3-hydroxymyristoyl)glucosamine N-acyltransferase [Tepidisphaeraceae bacterium]